MLLLADMAIGEFRSAVKRVRAAGRGGAAPVALFKTVHNWPGLPIIVAQEFANRLTRSTRESHWLSELLAELNQIAFPVTKLLAISNDIRAAQDVEFRANL